MGRISGHRSGRRRVARDEGRERPGPLARSRAGPRSLG